MDSIRTPSSPLQPVTPVWVDRMDKKVNYWPAWEEMLILRDRVEEFYSLMECCPVLCLCLFVESSGTFLNKICNSLLPIPDLNLFRRTLSAVLCDNVPLNSKSKQKLRFPENAFKIEQATKNLNCQDIIRERHLNFEEIAQEIVNSFGNQISTKRNI